LIEVIRSISEVLSPEEKTRAWLADYERAARAERRSKEARVQSKEAGSDIATRRTGRRLKAEGGFDAFHRAFSALRRAGKHEEAAELGKRYPKHHRRWYHEAFPQIKQAASDFQTNLNKVKDVGQRGWRADTTELDYDDLHRLAKKHGVNPGYFITAEQSHTEKPKSKKARALSKRMHILHLTRAFGGKHQANIDPSTARQEPSSHSFPSRQHAENFLAAVRHHYPKMRGLKVKTYQYTAGPYSSYGRYGGSVRAAHKVEFTHEKMGAPYPEGSRALAKQQARKQSKVLGVPYHVVLNPDTARYETTRRLHGEHDPHLTYERGKIAARYD
jgi:hypothetical protein